jgi:hypothetical protein
MKKVIIEIRSGIPEIIEIPEDVEIEIHDYDILSEDGENIKKDEFGDLYEITTHSKE